MLVLIERWLTANICSTDVLNSRYTVYRNNRNASNSSAERAGGVLIVVHKNLSSAHICDASTLEEV